MQFFSNIQKELLDRIHSANFSLKIAVTWFTNHDLFNAIINKLNNPKFKVQLIVLNDRINNKKEGIDFQKIIAFNGEFYYSNIEKMVHHKFCIIDDEVVITGSYNWTYYAENRNWENIVVLSDKDIVIAYVNEFGKIIKEHNNVTNVKDAQRFDSSINSGDYLESDYIFQARSEEQKGNDLDAVKIYNEILNINPSQQSAFNNRKILFDKIFLQRFEVSPFEIGILYENGYSILIPAFDKLPKTVTQIGCTTIANATSLRIVIQKNDRVKKNIFDFFIQDYCCPR